MQDTLELISVIVPVYNTEQYLEKCLDSITKQTYINLEIILVDDGSTDCSAKICDRYAENDKRIQVIHKKNQGVSAARNDGIKVARGQYIAFVDSDDYLLPAYFTYLYDLLKTYNADMSCCNLYKMWDTETLPLFDNLESDIEFTAQEAMKNFLYGKTITGHPFLKLYKKDLVRHLHFQENIHYGEDILFTLHILQTCRRVVYGNRILYTYIQNESSATHAFDIKKMHVSWKMIQKEIEEYASNNETLCLAAYARLLVLATMFCSAMKKKGDLPELRDELMGAIQQYGRFVVKDRECKKLIRIMAFISCISPKLLVQLSRLSVFLRRTLKIAIRKSV